MKYRYRPDDEMKDSGVEWLEKIPKDWRILKLKRITHSVKNGIWGDDEQHNSDDIPCIRILNFDRNKMQIDINDLTLRNIPKEKQKNYLLNKGDLLIEKSGGGEKNPVGFVAIYNHIVPSVYANFIAKISLNDNANSNYVKYLCSDIYNKRVHMDSVNQTTGIQNLDTERYFSRVITLPDIKEQEKIANFLDEKTSQFDLIISKKEELIKKLEEAKKSLISEVVIGKVKVVKTVDGYELVKRSSDEMKDSGVEWLGEIPKDWEVKKFSNVIKISNGQVNPKISPYSEMILIAPNHIKSGMGKIINLETAKEQGAESGKYICDKGDIIYSKIRPNLCKVCIAPIECLCSADMYPMKTDYKILNQEYLLWILLSDNFTRYVVLESDRVAMPKVNRESIAKFKIPTPSIEEQISLNKILKQNDRVIDNLINKTKLQIEKLKEAKQSLISEAVTGKIEILD